ncbi:hypothetical protein LC092_06435 [Stappia stellulata]|uniref:hypothetical protein n=1 Tax=Stappia stellulata TaxID=71235 RepID=UPI001CD752AB|nr:hypothetical protein [Stappia stellulata]MCA1242067.1 hypothetical protein [Stappia stellulata]
MLRISNSAFAWVIIISVSFIVVFYLLFLWAVGEKDKFSYPQLEIFREIVEVSISRDANVETVKVSNLKNFSDIFDGLFEIGRSDDIFDIEKLSCDINLDLSGFEPIRAKAVFPRKLNVSGIDSVIFIYGDLPERFGISSYIDQFYLGNVDINFKNNIDYLSKFYKIDNLSWEFYRCDLYSYILIKGG